jgi:trans-aconitate methyltransferase
MKPFERQYWKENYSDFKTIDGIGNVKDHSRYVKSYFNLEGFGIESLIDLGFGHGHLMKEFDRVFKPRRVTGIEPSEYVFKKIKFPKARLLQTDLLSWSEDKKENWIYDLGICNSVIQYIKTPDLKKIFPILAKRVRYLYLTVPTNLEYDRQKTELDFVDRWAIHRTQKQYLNLFKDHFTIVTSRILESKYHFDESNTPFQDLLFRF